MPITLEEIESGKVKGVPLEESLARAQNRRAVKFSLHPEADEEFAGAVRYYSEISAELGGRFYREMETRIYRRSCTSQ